MRRAAVGAVVLVLGLVLTPAPQAGAATRSYRYVTDSLTFGSNATEALSYAFDLDGDRRKENVMGQAFAQLATVAGFDAAMADALEAGDVVILHTLRADSLKDDLVASWRVQLGTPQPDPVLTGGGTFTVDPSAPTGTRQLGGVADGRFGGRGGTIVLRLALAEDGSPVEVSLNGARVRADCLRRWCQGKLGGGITATEFDAEVVPAVAARLQEVVESDPDCEPPLPESCDGPPRLILDIFDADHDGEVTADELRANLVFAAVFLPDLDLLDAEGQPGQDGVNESISLGLGFTTRYATFAGTA
jgi:hypothetical protein